MKKNFKTLALVAFAACAMLTSCENEGDNARYISNYFTITGDVETGYTLYQDGGGIVKPSTASIVSAGGKDGFGKNERAMLTFKFEEENIKQIEGGKIVENAYLLEGDYMPLHFPMTLEEAESKMITAPDSLFNVNRLIYTWCYRGYLNTRINAPVVLRNGYVVRPGINMVYNPADIKDNYIELKVCYNRHSAKGVLSDGNQEFVSTFPLYNIGSLIPGDGEVTIKVSVDGAEPLTLKVDRKDLERGNYLPYK